MKPSENNGFGPSGGYGRKEVNGRREDPSNYSDAKIREAVLTKFAGK